MLAAYGGVRNVSTRRTVSHLDVRTGPWSVSSTFSGDRVLVVSIGAFGDRFADIAQTYGADVTKLPFEWGTAADPAKLDGALSGGAGAKAVLVTHETGRVTNPLAELAAVAPSTMFSRLHAAAASALFPCAILDLT
jgi:hypothetical protein